MFSIVIPLYNEAENISELLSEIDLNLQKYKQYEVILVDDVSTDQTLHIINNISNKNYKILTNTKNSGQSFSIHRGIKHSSYEIIVTLDGDGQNDPFDIPKLIDNYILDGEIKLLGGLRKKRQDNLLKKISSKIANLIRSKILSDDCVDTGCSLKVFNRKIFLAFPYFDGIHRFLPALFKGYGFKTKFIDVNHRKRKFGFSKYGTFNRLFRGIIDLIRVYKIISKKVND